MLVSATMVSQRVCTQRTKCFQLKHGRFLTGFGGGTILSLPLMLLTIFKNWLIDFSRDLTILAPPFLKNQMSSQKLCLGIFCGSARMNTDLRSPALMACHGPPYSPEKPTKHQKMPKKHQYSTKKGQKSTNTPPKKAKKHKHSTKKSQKAPILHHKKPKSTNTPPKKAKKSGL